jgi:hypothetical protein
VPTAIAALLLVLFSSREAITAGSHVLPMEPALLRMFADVAGRSRRGDLQRETAAFVWRDVEGAYGCTVWPSHHSWRAEQSSGPAPPGTIAVVHTHPKGLERPSQDDVAECMRTGYTFYVITFWQIYRIEPATGVVISVIWNQDWTRDFRVQPTMGKVCEEQSVRR